MISFGPFMTVVEAIWMLKVYHIERVREGASKEKERRLKRLSRKEMGNEKEMGKIS